MEHQPIPTDTPTDIMEKEENVVAMEEEFASAKPAPPAQSLPSDLTEPQKLALGAMQKTFLGQEGYGMPMNDKTFLRYLRARTWDVNKATALLNGTIKWRKEFGVANMDSWSDIIAVENATGKTYVRGFDKEGHVLVYMRPAKENTRVHANNMKHLVYQMERAIACMEADGRQEKLSLVIDYQNYSLSDAPPMKTSTETLTILQDHYPERLYRAYCLYPPFIFWAFFKMVSPFIDPVTRAKIVMIKSSEMAKPDNQLFREVDRSILESTTGGEDARPFDSSLYLRGPFSKDYLAILNDA